MTVSMHPKGTNFARVALALARAKGDTQHAAVLAEQRWGSPSVPAIILRSAVSAGSTTDATWAASIAEYRVAAAEFVEALRPLTLLGRMTGFRRAPLNVKIPRATSGSSVGWVGQGKPTPVSQMVFDQITMKFLKMAGIVVSTKELIMLSTPAADGLVRADLLAAVAAMSDQALIDLNAAEVAGVSPASITSGATQIASSGSTVAQISSDFELLFDELTGNGITMASPYFIMSPRTAFKLAMKRDTNGALAFPGMGARGGEIAGVPALVTGANQEANDSPQSSNIVLLDAAELIVADTDQIMIDMSGEATIQMDTAPDSPPTASTVMVSLWQQNLAAWRVVRPINWQLRRPGAVATLTGCVY